MAAAVRMSRCSSSTASASTATWSARSPPKCRLLMNSVIASEAKQSRAVTAYSGLPRPPEQIRGLRHDGAGLPPDANAFFGRQVERLAFLDVERLVPGVELAHRQRRVHARRVAHGRELLAERRGARLVRQGWGMRRGGRSVGRGWVGRGGTRWS